MQDGQKLVSLGMVSQHLQLLPGQIEAAAERLGLRPTLMLNEVANFRSTRKARSPPSCKKTNPAAALPRAAAVKKTRLQWRK
jgi:hypothetical protein